MGTSKLPSAIAVQPNTAGNFAHNTANGLNINIDRNILGTTDVQPVVNGFDALQARKVLLNDLTFIPNAYQMVAMDVNIDGFVSAGDVSQINQRAVLLIPEFKQAWNYNQQGQSNGQPSKDWLFIDSVRVQTNPAYTISTTYPANNGIGFSKSKSPIVPFCLPIPVVNPTTCPIITAETYKGVMIGDVNGNFATVGSGGIFRNADDKVVFDLSKAVVANGIATVPVYVKSIDAVNALDFALQYNESKLSFNTVVDNTNSLDALSHYNADDKTVRFTSNSLVKYDLNVAPVSVRFAINAADISDADLSSLTAYINGDAVTAEVISRNAASATTESNFAMVYPNPASEMINVVVAEDATIQLFDVTGKQVIAQTNAIANQKYQINTVSLANGVYTMKISNNNFVSAQKIVIRK